MKRKSIRVLALIIALTIVLSIGAFAAIESSAYIAATNAWIGRNGNQIKVYFTIVGTATMDQIGVKYVYLYESSDYGWELVKTYDYTDLQYSATMMASSVSGHAGYLPYNGSADKLYFADCRFYAEKDGGSDTIPQNTPIG